jgi:hypothetical protein
MPTRRYVFVAVLSIALICLSGCDNRTRDGKRWDQIAEVQKTDKNAQRWKEASSPWGEVEHHSVPAW